MVATGNYEKGQLTHPGKHYVDTLPMAASTEITKGKFVKSSSGNAANMVDSDTNLAGVYVALETVDNNPGSAGDKEIQVAGAGSEVCVEAGGAIQPGGLVKLDSNSKVVAAIAGDVEADKIVGRYLRHPGEDKATAAADTDVVIIKLGASA